MAPSKTLKNISLIVPGHSKRLSNLRTKSIKALKNWDTAQKKKHRSRNNEILLKRNAANALTKYSNAIVEEEENKEYIGTAQNMSDHYFSKNTTINKNYEKNKGYRNLQRSRENAREVNKGLSGVGINKNLNRMFNVTSGGRRRTTMKHRNS
jgi:hypothetical protein